MTDELQTIRVLAGWTIAGVPPGGVLKVPKHHAARYVAENQAELVLTGAEIARGEGA